MASTYRQCHFPARLGPAIADDVRLLTHEVDILRRQVTYHVYNAGCFIRLNRVSYPGYVVYI